MARNRVDYAGETLIDISGSTVTPSTLGSGVIAFDKDGNQIVGTMDAGAGGEFHAYSHDNGDGTQTIVITDAEGGSAAPPSVGDIDDTVVEYDSTNAVAAAYIAAARAQYPVNPNLTIIANYVDTSQDLDKPNGYEITGIPAGCFHLIDEATDKHWSERFTAAPYAAHNLVPKHNNTYVVTGNGAVQKIGRLRDTAALRMLWLNKTNNFRDLGGWPCDGGTMRYGLMIRGARAYSDSGIKLDARDISVLRDWCNIHTEIDMRDADELVGIQAESPIGKGVQYLNLDIGGGYTGHFGIGSSHIARAREIVETIMTNAINGEATYFHCTGGADRTGTVASILEGVCGCSSVDIDIDYELTSFTPWDGHLRPRYGTDGYGKSWAEWRAHIASLGGDNPWVTWCIQAGISVNKINAFRKAVIDGNPSIIDGGGDTPGGDIADSADLALAVNADGSPYNGGSGYRMSARLGSDGLEDTAPSGIGVTGFIPIRIGDTIRVEGMDIAANNTFEGYSSSYYRVAVYDSDFNNIYTGSQYSALNRTVNSPVISGDFIRQFTLNKLSGTTAITGTAYIRFSFRQAGDPAVYINR